MKSEQCRADTRISKARRLRAGALFGIAGLSLTGALAACGEPADRPVPLEAGLVQLNPATGAATIRGCLYQNEPGGDQSDPATLRRLALRTDEHGHVGAVTLPVLAYTDAAKNAPQAMLLNEVPAYSFVAAGVKTAQYGFDCTEIIADGAKLAQFDGAVVRLEPGPGDTIVVTGPFRDGIVAASPGVCDSRFASPAPQAAPAAVGACLGSVIVHAAA